MEKIKDITEIEYARGFQCLKMLWLDEHMPEAAAENAENMEDFAQKEIYETVKNAALEYFSPCVQVREEKIKRTRQYLEAGEKKIADAAFCYENLFCVIDMLLVEKNSISIIYINSSTKTKMKYYDKMAYQYYILEKIFPKKTKKMIHMHINGKYVRGKELDLKQLFVMEDCTKEVRERQKETKKMIDLLKGYMQKGEAERREEAKKEVGVHCYLPNHCPYIKYCHREIVEPSIFSIYGLNAQERYELYHAGIVSFSDVLQKEAELLEGQRIQVETEVFDKKPTIKKDKIREFLGTLTYPLYFLDFESFQQVIPEYEGVRPYLPIPFQYSLHVQREENGEVEHYEFLAEEGTDPRREVAKHLCRYIPKDVCILAYNMGFEKSVVRNLASLYPDLEEHLLNLQENMRDLMIPFRNYSYYCKEMEGSHSIKSVLPALYPKQKEYDYEALAGVHNGQEAMNTFRALTKYSKKERKKIRKQLLDYCSLDTLGMVKILEKLKEAVRK